ncbi:MAG: primase C-terminal domain-containing protein [Dehalococcoidales bacterium]|nr:primase C-terminal domain-containing protein [Dehalococcoidales bacterium]
MNRAELLLQFFAGRKDCFTQQQEDGSYIRVARELTPEVLEQHVQGSITIGSYLVVPVINRVQVGVIDLDSKTPQCKERVLWLKHWLEHFGLKPLIEPSGNKGYHLWLVFKAWLLASDVQRLLKAAVRAAEEALGKPDYLVEIFPKETMVTEGKFGSGVKLVWGVHRKTGKRTTFVDETFQPLEDWGVPVVEALPAVPEGDLQAILLEFPAEPAPPPRTEAPKSYALPCFGKMLAGVPEGSRHIASFRLACHLARQGMPEQRALATLLEWDASSNHPPLGQKHIERNLKDGYSGKYKLGCADIETLGFCQPDCPIKRKAYQESDDRLEVTPPVIERLVELNCNPPAYLVTVQGKMVQIDGDDLFELKSFIKKVGMSAHVVPCQRMKQKDWYAEIHRAFSHIIMEKDTQAPTIEAEIDTTEGRTKLPPIQPDSDESEVINRIYTWLRNAPKAINAPDVDAGRPILRDQEFCFKVDDAVTYLKSKHHLAIKRQTLYTTLKRAGGYRKSTRLDEGVFDLWRLPYKPSHEKVVEQKEESSPLDLEF